MAVQDTTLPSGSAGYNPTNWQCGTLPQKKERERRRRQRRERKMGSCWSSWWNLERGQGSGSNLECLSSCLLSEPSQEPGGERSLEKKLVSFEQKVTTLELRLNTIDEANQRLYNKWNTTEERFQQQEGAHQGDTRALMIRCKALEQQMERLSIASFDHCDDIIVIEE